MNSQLVFLAQTETTAGFLSQNSQKLVTSKQRNQNQRFIRCVDSLKTLKEFTRVPQKFKKGVRSRSLTTFVYPNGEALRVVKDEEHLRLMKKLKWTYSSSANLTSKSFEESYAKQKADIIVEDSRGFFETQASSIIKINKKRARRLR